MAIVPTYDRFQVTPGELPQATVNTPNLHPELAGQAATAMGEGLSHIGGDVGKMAQFVDCGRETGKRLPSLTWCVRLKKL